MSNIPFCHPGRRSGIHTFERHLSLDSFNLSLVKCLGRQALALRERSESKGHPEPACR